MRDLKTLDALFKHYKISPHIDGSWSDKALSPAEARRRFRDADTQNLIGRVENDGRVVELAERVEEIGTPGTPIRRGVIEADASPKARPFVLRGRRGRPGDLEAYYRTEPILRDAIDSVVEVQMGATREIHPPKVSPDGLEEEMAEWVDTLNGWFNNLEGGLLDSYVFPATQSMCIFGFAPFEVVWAVDETYRKSGGSKGLAWPVKIAYRETSTVEGWLMNDRQDTLLAVEFSTGGETQLEYQLTASGDVLTDQQFLNCRIAGRGNNWEGISPTRTALHWVRFKRLLGQIAAVAAQKYGVPYTMIKVDPALINDQLFALLNTTEADVEDAIAQFDAAEAVEASVYYLPPPLTAETTGPQGQMPSLEELLRYCDEMMSRPYSNEGALLGHNQVGSYAMADIADNKFLRSAPAYARLIDTPLNNLIRRMTIQKFGRLLPEYPTVQMQLNTQDAKNLVKDIILSMGGTPVTTWPPKLQQALLELFGLPPDALDALEEKVDEVIKDEIDARVQASNIVDFPGAVNPSEPEPDQAAKSDREFNGAQISSMAAVVQSVAADELPEKGAIEILKLGFNLSDVEARALFAGKETADNLPVSDDGAPAVELSEKMARCFEEFKLGAEDLQKFMDAAEAKLAKEWARIAEAQRKEIRARTKGVSDAMEIDRIGDDIAAKYKGDYHQAAVDVADTLSARGASTLLRELGIKAPANIKSPELPAGIRQQLDLRLLQAAKEANNRNVQNAIDQRISEITRVVAGQQDRSVSRLKNSTLAAIAAKATSTAFNSGRAALVQKALAAHEEKTGETQAGARSPAALNTPGAPKGLRGATAVRTSMLDGDVCPACLALDFERGGPTYVVGSAAYYRDMPPKPCFSGGNCRCAYIYEIPDEMAESFAAYMNAQLIL